MVLVQELARPLSLNLTTWSSTVLRLYYSNHSYRHHWYIYIKQDLAIGNYKFGLDILLS